MDPAEPAGRHERDSRGARDRERAANRRRPDCALLHRDREVARADLARGGVEARELVLCQPDDDVAVEDADRRRDGARCAHLPLGLHADLDALARREAVCDERRLERDDRRRLAHLVRDADHAGRSISTKRLRSSAFTSRKPARRYARSARSFQRATHNRKRSGSHCARA